MGYLPSGVDEKSYVFISYILEGYAILVQVVKFPIKKVVVNLYIFSKLFYTPMYI